MIYVLTHVFYVNICLMLHVFCHSPVCFARTKHFGLARREDSDQPKHPLSLISIYCLPGFSHSA